MRLGIGQLEALNSLFKARHGAIDSWIEFHKQEYFNNSGRSLNLSRIRSPWERNKKLVQVLDDLSRSRTGAL
jgi:hypothetical protein